MKYMLIMRATDEAYAAFQDVDFDEIMEAMGRFNDEMISAGVLVAAEGLDDAAEGVVIDFSSQPPVVTDGPYGETKELFGGFWILDVASKEEAVEWAKRAPMTGPGRRPRSAGSPSIDEFPQDNEWIQKERAWRERTGPALSRSGRGRDAVEAVWRIESARIVATLARYTGDFALAEDLAQEALAEALVALAARRVPRSPAGVAAHRRAGAGRSTRSGGASALDERYAVLARDLTESVGDDLLWDPDRIDDDVLALMFISCHPVLSREAQVALTLRVVGGLTSDEIARAFLVPTATVQARITRAKKTLAAAQVPFEVPPPEERRERLGSVLSVLYLVFTEGSSATSGSDWIRPDLAHEAVRLARVLAQLVPDEPEVHGLLALLELTAARFPARVRDDGEPVLLEEQDRRRWDRVGDPARARGPGHGRSRRSRAGCVRACRPRSPSATRSPRRSRRPTGTGSSCCTRRSAGWRRRPSSS